MRKYIIIILSLLLYPIWAFAATKTITDFNALSPMDDADEFVVWDIAPGATKKVTKDVLFSSPGAIGDTTASTGAFTALVSNTLDTGQGAYELYAMNQDVSTSSTPYFPRLGLGIAADGAAQLKIAFDAAAYTLFTQADAGALTIAQVSDGTDEIILKAAGNTEFSLTDAGLQLGGADARVSEFSIDGTLAGNSDTAIPTEKAVKTYADSLGGLPVYNIEDYGAIGDGSTDDSTAVQAAVTAATGAGGGIVFFPEGDFRVDSTITITSNCTIMGASVSTWGPSYLGSRVKGVTTNIPIFHITGNASVAFQNITIYHDASVNGVPTAAQSGIYITQATSWNAGSSFENVILAYNYNNIHTVEAGTMFMRGCTLMGPFNNGYNIRLRNAHNSDSGDHVFVGNYFNAGNYDDLDGDPGTNPAVSQIPIANIWYESGGGAKFLGNKFISPADYGLYVNWDENTSTSTVMTFTGNSVEGTTNSGIYCKVSGGFNTMSKFSITGNEFGGNVVYFEGDNANTTSLFNVNITGNTFINGAHANATVCVTVEWGFNVIISGNAFYKAGNLTNAIKILNSSTATIGINDYYGFTNITGPTDSMLYRHATPTATDAAANTYLFGPALYVEDNISVGYGGAATDAAKIGVWAAGVEKINMRYDGAGATSMYYTGTLSWVDASDTELYLDAAGNLTADGTVTGAAVTATGTVSGATVSSSGTVAATTSITAGADSTIDGTVNDLTLGDATNGGKLRILGDSGMSYPYTISTAGVADLNIISSRGGAIAVTIGSLGKLSACDVVDLGTCDYVFEPGYDLLSLDALNDHIKNNMRLPGIHTPNGVSVSELYEKTEEQAIYILQLHDRLTKLEKKGELK